MEINWEAVAKGRLTWVSHLANLILKGKHDPEHIAQNIIAICNDPVRGYGNAKTEVEVHSD